MVCLEAYRVAIDEIMAIVFYMGIGYAFFGCIMGATWLFLTIYERIRYGRKVEET